MNNDMVHVYGIYFKAIRQRPMSIYTCTYYREETKKIQGFAEHLISSSNKVNTYNTTGVKEDFICHMTVKSHFCKHVLHQNVLLPLKTKCIFKDTDINTITTLPDWYPVVVSMSISKDNELVSTVGSIL